MEGLSRPGASPPLDRGLLAAAACAAVTAAEPEEEPGKAISTAITSVYEGVAGVLPSVFVVEHGRLWLVAQRGYAVVPDGIPVGRGIMGRAVRTRAGQLVVDVRDDPDYVEGLPGVRSELSVPLVAGDDVVGVLNVEAKRALPSDSLALVEPLVTALTPWTEALRAATTLDLSALARLFVYLGSLRDPDEIAALGAASLSRVLPVRAGQVWTWDGAGGASQERSAWHADATGPQPLTSEELERIRALVDPTVVCQVLGHGARAGGDAVVWLPLRTNALEIGSLVGVAEPDVAVDPAQLDAAAVLAAHVASSLDAALALQRERESAETDPLTGILNRRGLEQRLERALAAAQQRREALSLVVFDCDDFKELNDRAGHEFGDALLREVGDVLARSVPSRAEVGRLGGDEFVVMLPGLDVEAATGLAGESRAILAAGLMDAGFPLHLSAGVATYPYDGAAASTLLRSADQALYAAKNGGKDRVASFRSLVQSESAAAVDAVAVVAPAERGARSARDGSILADAIAAAKAIEAEQTPEAVLARLCKSLVFVIGATGCSASYVVGDLLVDATEHALREVWLGDEAAYRVSDFPLTEEALRTGEPRAVSFLDRVDPAEAFILRELEMNAMLMLPLSVHGKPWGLIEVYEMRLRRFTEEDISIAGFLATQAMRRLDAVSPGHVPLRRPPVYRLPPPGTRGTPRTR
jgi:diguanylate cyclase (GGDEF)-like protein